MVVISACAGFSGVFASRWLRRRRKCRPECANHGKRDLLNRRKKGRAAIEHFRRWDKFQSGCHRCREGCRLEGAGRKRAKGRHPRPKCARVRYTAQELIDQMPGPFEIPDDLKAWESMEPIGKELGAAETPWISPPAEVTHVTDNNPQQDK